MYVISLQIKTTIQIIYKNKITEVKCNKMNTSIKQKYICPSQIVVKYHLNIFASSYLTFSHTFPDSKYVFAI